MFEKKDIDLLREKISSLMSPFRLEHTVGVEQMALKIGSIFAPEKSDLLSAAALLHDITKEKTFENQLQICEKLGIITSSAMRASPKTLHAITAAALIPSEFPLFAENEVISAVRWHTTGRENMTLCEKIIYLADYIEEGRTYSDCVDLRKYFFSADLEKMNESEREMHLDMTLILSFDMTIKQLLCEGVCIAPETNEARNSLILNVK